MATNEQKLAGGLDVHDDLHQHIPGAIGRGHIDHPRHVKGNRGSGFERNPVEDYGPPDEAFLRDHIDGPLSRISSPRAVGKSPAETGSPWPVTRRVRKASAHEYQTGGDEHWYGVPGNRRQD
jgi:hypothetical protein